MKKEEVLKIIDEVMNNREIDSIRNAILAIRDKVIDAPDPDIEDSFEKDYIARLRLRGHNPVCKWGDYFEGAEYVCIDTSVKVDRGIYGVIWYE